jgi:threonine/homoserine efflux transporter RhtA
VLVLGQTLPAHALIAIACVTAAAIGVTITDRRAVVQEPV